MAKLVWDASGERVYQSGISHGVLYMTDGRVIVWNGLTSMDEAAESENTSYYIDGVKYLQKNSPGEFSGKLKAWTYPEELDEVLGISEVAPGLHYHEQPPKRFSLSYRTNVGNDTNPEAGYKLHLLYNLLAVPDDVTYDTLSDGAVSPTEFGWSLTGTPPPLTGYRPTVHVMVDSTKADPGVLQALEDTLYGTDTTGPQFPSISDIRQLFESFGVLVIIDNGDGTWTAIDTANDFITMDGATQFTITDADATMLDATTYTITTT